MKVAIGCDHGGLDLKESVISVMKNMGLEVLDLGTNDRTSVDYPDYAEKVAGAVVAGTCDQGVLICGTGIGMCISANKIHGIRAALAGDPYSARMARQHNNANILCIGARVVGPGVAEEIVHAYFANDFEGDRHARRVAKIMALEERKQG